MRLLGEVWPGLVDLGGWLHSERIYQSHDYTRAQRIDNRDQRVTATPNRHIDRLSA